MSKDERVSSCKMGMVNVSCSPRYGNRLNERFAGLAKYIEEISKSKSRPFSVKRPIAVDAFGP